MAQPITIRQESFLGGVFDAVTANLIPTNGAQRLQNCDISTTGTLRRRGGLRLHRELVETSTDQPLLLKSAVVRQKLRFLTGIYNTAFGESHVFIDEGLAGILDMTAPWALSEKADAIELLDRIYFCQPGQPPLFWEPGRTALSRELATPGFPGTSIPYISTGVYFMGRAWGGGDLAKPDLVYFSGVLGTGGNGESGSVPFAWDKDFQAFRMQTGRVEAIIPFRNQALVVFTDRGVESLEPNPCNILETHRITLNTYTGCACKHTVQACGEDLFFMDQEGHIRSLAQTELDENRGVTNAPLSLRIQNVILRQNKNALKRARATFSKGIYWIAMPMDFSLYANELWGWSIREQCWVGPHRFAFDADDEDHLIPAYIGGLAGHFYDGDEERLYVMLKTADGAIKTMIALEMEDLDDDGVLIPVSVDGPSYAPGPYLKKTWQHVAQEFRFIHAPQDQTFSVTVDIRNEEGGWVSVGTRTVSPDAAPALPVNMPTAMTPYARQEIKQALTSLARSNGVQVRVTIRDQITQWEMLSQTTSGFPDPQEYDR